MQGGNQEPKILQRGPQEIAPKIGAMRGRNPQNPKSWSVGLETAQMLEINKNGTSNCLTTVQKDNLVIEHKRIRKLTPLECWRLQDFPDEAYNKAKASGVSQTQLYKQSGNSMSVNVLEMIFRQIINGKNSDSLF
jgi:DNA (cytosine-5)-methyltransferase 1